MTQVVVDTGEMRIERLELGQYATNAYVVVCACTGDSALIDVPAGARTILKSLKDSNLRYVLLTHNHIDHIGGLRAFRVRNAAPLAIHAADNQRWLPFAPEVFLKDGTIIKVGKLKIEALHTPGHTPGSMCFRIGEYLISGDTIFPGGPGRTVSPADFRQVVRSIVEKILVLPDDTRIYPGHGEPTILKKEKDEFALFSSRPHDPALCGDVVWLTS